MRFCALALFLVGASGQRASEASIREAANAASSAAGTTTMFTEAEKEALLFMHNEDRRQQGASNMMQLSWDDKIAKHAQEYADTCPSDHSTNRGEMNLGENLAWGMPSMSVFQAMDGWVEKEKVDYNYDTNTCKPGKMCGHYTAAVWAGTQKIGCGKKLCNGGILGAGLQDHIVCQYWPAGNMMGEKPFKKGKACSACAGVCNDGLCVPKTTCAAGDWVMKGSGGFDGFFNLGFENSGQFNGAKYWQSSSYKIYRVSSFGQWAIGGSLNKNGYLGYAIGSADTPPTSGWKFYKNGGWVDASATLTKCGAK